jgi:hypothetical protein
VGSQPGRDVQIRRGVKVVNLQNDEHLINIAYEFSDSFANSRQSWQPIKMSFDSQLLTKQIDACLQFGGSSLLVRTYTSPFECWVVASRQAFTRPESIDMHS